MGDVVGQTSIRGENIARAIKGFALRQYKLKQVCILQTSSKWTETYYREAAAVLSGAGTRTIANVPRGANFPYVEPNHTKVQGQHIKYAAEGYVFMEDKLTDAIDVQARTIFRIAEAITKAVDDAIYSGLTGASGIQTAAAEATWDSAEIGNRDPINDILKGIQALDEENYDVLENGYLLLSPKDYRNLMRNSKVINNPSFKTADVVSNGKVGQIGGLTIIKTISVDPDEAVIIKGQRAATWQSAQALTSAVIEDQGKGYTIRSWEIGHLQVTDPKAIYVITNTQA